MDQVAPHDSILTDVLMGDAVVVIVFMMKTVSTTTLEASKPYYCSQQSRQEGTPLGYSVIKINNNNPRRLQQSHS